MYIQLKRSCVAEKISSLHDDNLIVIGYANPKIWRSLIFLDIQNIYKDYEMDDITCIYVYPYYNIVHVVLLISFVNTCTNMNLKIVLNNIIFILSH